MFDRKNHFGGKIDFFILINDLDFSCVKYYFVCGDPKLLPPPLSVSFYKECL